MTYYVISRSEDFTAGYFVGRGLLGGDKQHLMWDEVLSGKMKAEDTVVLIEWSPVLNRRDRNEGEKALFDSGCRLLNGAGYVYGWSDPKPWEHDGTVPGSALV